MKDLSEVASVSGKGGLYKVLKPGRAGVILESLDEKKTRMVTNPNHKVSILSEISLYANTEEGAVMLEDVFKKIYDEFGDDPGVDSKSTPDELMAFIEYIVPEYDPGRVYPSDVKKLVSWYHILLKEAPEVFEEAQEGEKKAGNEEKGSSKEMEEKKARGESVSKNDSKNENKKGK